MDKVLEKLNSMQVQFNGMQMQIDAKFDGMQRSNDAQIRSIKWTIISSVAICSLILGLIGLVIKFFPSRFINWGA